MKLRLISVVVLLIITAADGRAQTREQLLVDAAWLQKHLNDDQLVLLHVGQKPGYEREHIPGAHFISMSDVSAPMQHTADMDHARELMLELPDPAAARARLEALGISDDSHVVVYYGADWVSPTTRIAFALDWLGVRASVLDGGMPEWKRRGGTVTADLSKAKPGRLSARPVKAPVVDYRFVLANLKTPNIRIIDARDRRFYDGNDDGARPGHIPGATSLPYTAVTDDDLRFKPAAELARLFEKAGYKAGDTIVAYCHIGQQATAVVYAARTLGYDVKLYDGSYTQWEALGDTPVEKNGQAGTR